MSEYILVQFDETREVLVDEEPSGYDTGEVIELGAGTHTISLQGPDDFSPAQQDVTPSGTSALQPHEISFHKV